MDIELPLAGGEPSAFYNKIRERIAGVDQLALIPHNNRMSPLLEIALLNDLKFLEKIKTSTEDPIWIDNVVNYYTKKGVIRNVENTILTFYYMTVEKGEIGYKTADFIMGVLQKEGEDIPETKFIDTHELDISHSIDLPLGFKLYPKIIPLIKNNDVVVQSKCRLLYGFIDNDVRQKYCISTL